MKKALLVAALVSAVALGCRPNQVVHEPDPEFVFLAASGEVNAADAFFLVAPDLIYAASDSQWVPIEELTIDTAWGGTLWFEDWRAGDSIFRVYYAADLVPRQEMVVAPAEIGEWAVENRVEASLFTGTYPQSTFLSLIEPSTEVTDCPRTSRGSPTLRELPSAGQQLATAIGFPLCTDPDSHAPRLRPSSVRSEDSRCQYYSFPTDSPWTHGKLATRLQPDGSRRVVEVATFRAVPGRPLGLPNVRDRITDKALRAALGESASMNWNRLGIGVWSAEHHGVRVGIIVPERIVGMLSGYVPNDCSELWR